MGRTKHRALLSQAASGGASLGQPGDRPEGGARASFEQRLARLHKKSSFGGTRADTYNEDPISPAAYWESPTPEAGMEPNRPRKGSIRSAVRRIFGRRSREVDFHTESENDGRSTFAGPTYHFSPARHGYHSSEPPRLSTTRESLEQPRQEEEEVEHEHETDIIARTLSVPVAPLRAGEALRARSPYAVEFPHSARLKPLALGDPFYAPGSRLRRRKTLPSVQVSDADAEAISKAIQASEEPSRSAARNSRVTGGNGNGNGNGHERNGSIKSLARRKRISRSADDLRGEVLRAATADPSRKRSDDVRFWRESFQGSVVRASGFLLPSPPMRAREQGQQQEEAIARLTALPRDSSDPFVEIGSPAEAVSSREEEARGDSEYLSPSAIGTEMSRELEDRVAKLESNLQNFSDALRRLTTGRTRERGVVDDMASLSSSRRRDGVVRDEGRTASMLIESLELAGTLSPSPPPSFVPSVHHHSRYGSDDPRPTRAPRTPPPQPTRARARSAATTTQRPQIPPRTSNINTTAPLSASALDPPAAFHIPPSTSSQYQALPSPQQHTFRSLYEMLSDERIARLRLEKQMRGLKQELMDLQWQVSASTAASSMALTSSSLAAGRLQPPTLLQRGSSREQGVASGHSSYVSADRGSEDRKVVSRFSGESEALDLEDEEDNGDREEGRTSTAASAATLLPPAASAAPETTTDAPAMSQGVGSGGMF